MKKLLFFQTGIILLIVLLVSATSPLTVNNKNNKIEQSQIRVVHLSDGDTSGLAEMRATFKKRNPGYNMYYYEGVERLSGEGEIRLAFIQKGEGLARLNGQDTSSFSVGDIIHLENDEYITTDKAFDALVFKAPKSLPENIPNFVRPDWDPNITDVPGGCATETNAYRRILLTWLDKVGPYQYHALNAHRVRIMDSFTHYHPEDKGFDEFYLVQMAMPGARLYTSDRVSEIQNPENVSETEAQELVNETPLKVGDLVYLPRGTAHRGYGGVLAQVITVPGFVPGSEIGLDHHLRAINERLSLDEERKLPYNKFASTHAVVK